MTVAIVKIKFTAHIACFEVDEEDKDADEVEEDVRAMTRKRNHKTWGVNRAYTNNARATFGDVWDGLIWMACARRLGGRISRASIPSSKVGNVDIGKRVSTDETDRSGSIPATEAMVFGSIISGDKRTDQQRSNASALVNQQKLDRVVIDKYHLTVAAVEYRPNIVDRTNVCSLREQFIYLTATLSLCKQREFEEHNHLFRPITIRASSNRSNMFYMVRKVDFRMGSLVERAAAEVEDAWIESDLFDHSSDRIIFCSDWYAQSHRAQPWDTLYDKDIEIPAETDPLPIQADTVTWCATANTYDPNTTDKIWNTWNVGYSMDITLAHAYNPPNADWLHKIYPAAYPQPGITLLDGSDTISDTCSPALDWKNMTSRRYGNAYYQIAAAVRGHLDAIHENLQDNVTDDALSIDDIMTDFAPLPPPDVSQAPGWVGISAYLVGGIAGVGAIAFAPLAVVGAQYVVLWESL
ncbi:hypothetical protein LTR17_026395 [Elasticomyces elasticus]|nr:hypothetical protein LTR17_026395 [Elasticomyces elasticus]